jgi:hypothetical protein
MTIWFLPIRLSAYPPIPPIPSRLQVLSNVVDPNAVKARAEGWVDGSKNKVTVSACQVWKSFVQQARVRLPYEDT